MPDFNIRVERASESRLPSVDLDNIAFGREFSDHMLVADFDGEKWSDVRIEPYADITISPACTALHYGQSIFEGLKAYKNDAGEAVLFRPHENWKRLCRSSRRMCMVEVPEEIFIDGLQQLIDIDRDWIPSQKGSALYIRPFLFATDEYVGIRPSLKYKFVIFTSPANSYYPEPVKVCIEEYYTRAAQGGIGAAKAAANYGASLYPASLAAEKGYHQLIWTDAAEHKYIEESGTMNVFFVIDGKLITPATDRDTILKGITRDSVLTLAREMGYEVEERAVEVVEVIQALKDGRLQEAFGAGTAATIAHIRSIGYQDANWELPAIEEREISNKMLDTLDGIKYGRIADKYGWVLQVKAATV